jgi:hypothetical protein
MGNLDASSERELAKMSDCYDAIVVGARFGGRRGERRDARRVDTLWE